jgi:glucose-6-phosphate isomerase
LANGIAQGQAMTLGHVPANADEQHKRVQGNHPSTTVVLNSLGAEQIGCLLAIYEHKVFCQGVLWNINSFDQWGVELGKQLALPIFAQLSGEDASTQDPATRHLIDHCLGLNRAK